MHGAHSIIGSRPQPTLVVVFAIVALEFALSFWLASYLNDNVGLARGGRGRARQRALRRQSDRPTGREPPRPVHSPEQLLFAAIGCVFAGLPCLLAATSATAAVPGIVLAGAGIAALFPLTSSLHVQGSGHTVDSALGEILTVAAVGQIAGPLGAIAQASSVRAGLLVLPALTLLAAAGLTGHQRHANKRQDPHTTPARVRG